MSSIGTFKPTSYEQNVLKCDEITLACPWSINFICTKATYVKLYVKVVMTKQKIENYASGEFGYYQYLQNTGYQLLPLLCYYWFRSTVSSSN